MITLKKLKWSNCFSYGPDNELQLDNNTVTQIIGTNGMGKSSIPLIIEEALYNKNSKGIKKADIPNRYINDGYDIELEFEKSGKEYLIRINRKNNIKVALLEDGEDISSHTATNTYKSIQEIVGVDFKTFSQLVYQNTNASLQFLTATDTNRKKFLIDLLRLEEYVQLFEVFKEASRESSNKMIEVSSEITTIEKWLSNNKLEATNILPLLNLEIDTEEDEKTFRSLSIELKNISEKNKKILKNNQYKEMLSAIDINKIQSSLETLPQVESYDKYQSIIGQVEGAKRASDNMMQKLEQLGDKCPTCEQDIDAEFKNELIKAERKTLDFLASKKEDNEDIIRQIKRNNAARTNLSNAQKEWEDLFRNIDNTLPTNLLNAEELQEKLDEVSAKLKTAKAELANIASQNEAITKRNTRIEIIQAQTDGFIQKLGAAQEVLDQQKELDSNLEILKKAFSTNGLLAYKIENLVKELEELANSYLAELSDGRFTLEFIVSNDKLNVQITDNENIVDILALSSGELARVNTATLIAIRKLMSSISKSRINILFLDEVINVLDESGREKMVEVLLQEDLNTYVVSHGWTHPLLEKIEVVKEGNVSKLEW
jgi:DNA repair exonuclease SbcCD ATPase subunit